MFAFRSSCNNVSRNVFADHITISVRHWHRGSKNRKSRYRRIYGNPSKGEPKKMPRTRMKMFVPTHIAHKHDWSPVDRIWSMRDSKHDSVDKDSFTALIKETGNCMELLDVIGLSLRKHKRVIEWKPYHSCIAIHHLAQFEKTDGSIYGNRYLWDLLEECAISVAVLKPRFIAQTMWSLEKLGLTTNPAVHRRAKLCLMKCADSLSTNPLLHRLEIWNVADCLHVMARNKQYDHPLIAKLAQRIIDMDRSNEWFQINDVGKSYSVMAHSFGKMAKFRNIENENGDEDNIDWTALCEALVSRFMDDRIYRASDNFEILQFLKGIGTIMETVDCNKMRYTDSLRKLESDLHGNMGSMHVKDIAVITKALIHCVESKLLISGSLWFEEILKNGYLGRMIEQDALSLLEMDEAVDCLSYFIHILVELIGVDGKESPYYSLFGHYLSETLRFMELFREHYEQYQGEEEDASSVEPFDYDRFSNVIADFIRIFQRLTDLNLKDKQYFLFEQNLMEILVGFLESDSRLFSQITWRRLLSLESSADLLHLMLKQKSDVVDLNINVLRAVFSSMEYHLLNSEHSEKIQNAMIRDTTASRHVVDKMYDLMAIFTVFQQQHRALLVNEDDGEFKPFLISDEMKQFFVDLLIEEWNQKYHILTQNARKTVLRTLLILGGSEQDIDGLLTDFNRFAFYKGVKSAVLTQCIDDRTESYGFLLGQRVQSNAFKRVLSENGLFVSSAFVLSKDNVFQTKKLNEWRLERLTQDKMRNAEPWSEEGMVKGPLFEWRSGGVREGAGLHPTLNDVDLEELDDDEYTEIFNVDGQLDEDAAMLTESGDADYKRIILRSVCDLLLESNDPNVPPIAIFTDSHYGKCFESHCKSLCDLFQSKCVLIHDSSSLTDDDTFCRAISESV